MKIELSPLVADVSGPFAGFSFYRSQGRRIIRTIRADVPPPSAAQLAQRYVYGRVYRNYHQLQSKSNNSWDVAFGHPELSGWALYCAYNLARKPLLEPITPCIDCGVDIPAPTGLGGAWSGSNTFFMTFNVPPDAADYRIAVFAHDADSDGSQLSSESTSFFAETGHRDVTISDAKNWHLAAFFWRVGTLLTGSSTYMYIAKA